MVNAACNAQPPHVRMGALAWKWCVGCGCKISDRFLLFALDGYWHCHCLKCSCCQAQLAEIGSSCFIKRGLILCKSDYLRSDYRNNTVLLSSSSIIYHHSHPERTNILDKREQFIYTSIVSRLGV